MEVGGTEDAVFLIELVLELNRVALAIHGTEALRAAALIWELRARSAQGEGGERPTSKPGWETWRSSVGVVAATIHRSEEVRLLLERHYLDGRTALFPDTVGGWGELRECADALMVTAAAGTRRGSRSNPDRVGASATTVAHAARALVDTVRGHRSGSRRGTCHCCLDRGAAASGRRPGPQTMKRHQRGADPAARARPAHDGGRG